MSHEALLQMVEQHEKVNRDAHQRLRETLTELADKVESNFDYLKDMGLANKSRIELVAAAPIDATKVVLSPRVVMLLLTMTVTIAGGVWASTSGLRSDVRDILTRMDAQRDAAAASAKLQELQMGNLARTVDDMKRRQELQQYEIQNLTKELARRTNGGER